MKHLLKLYSSKPLLVKKLILTHLLKTKDTTFDYLIHRIVPGLELNSLLRIYLLTLPEVTLIENSDNYEFNHCKNQYKLPYTTNTLILFSNLIRIAAQSTDREDFRSRIYENRNPTIIYLLERCIKGDNELLSELFSFLKSPEFDVEFNWTIERLINTKMGNYAKIVLNPKVWELVRGEGAFFLKGIELNMSYFEQEEYSEEGYSEYLKNINSTIDKYFQGATDIYRNRAVTVEWNCEICDGDNETGCQYFNPSECPRR